jgi:site-specific recombinase XerD
MGFGGSRSARGAFHRSSESAEIAPASVHVAGYIEELTRARSAPTAKQRLSAIRHLFDWLVVGQVMPANAMANHASTRTTQLYDRRRDEVNLDEVERISI